MERDALLYLLGSAGQKLGLLSLGIATGLQFALMTVQRAVVTEPFVPLRLQAPDAYPALLTLQQATNVAIVGAAILLLGSALLQERDVVLDYYRRVAG